jgi:hypothetical protein
MGGRIGVVDDAVSAAAPAVHVSARFSQVCAREVDEGVIRGDAVENNGDAVERSGDVTGEQGEAPGDSGDASGAFGFVSVAGGRATFNIGDASVTPVMRATNAEMLSEFRDMRRKKWETRPRRWVTSC